MSEDKQKTGGETARLLRELEERNQQLQAANQQLRANEQQLQAKEEQLRAVLDVTPFPVAVVDSNDHEVFFWSASAHSLFGHTMSTAEEWYEKAYPDEEYRQEVVERWRPRVEEARATGRTVNAGEYEVTCADGSKRICELYAAFVRGNLLVVFNDVTERKAAEQATRESERRFRAAFDHASVGRVLTLPDGRLARVNEAMGEMLGYSVEELKEKTFKEITHPDDLEGSHECVQALLDGDRQTWRLEKRYQHKDGRVVWTDVNTRLLRDDQGEPQHFITDIVDITQKKLAEREARGSMVELQRRTLELEGLLDGARAVLEKDEFEAIAKTLFTIAKELTGATSGYVALLNEKEEENELLFLEAGGMSCEVDPSLPMPVRGLRAEAYGTGKVVVENDFMNSEWVEYMPEGHAVLQNVLFAPLNIRGQAKGVLGLANKPEPFDERDIQIAGAMAQIAALGLQRWKSEEAVRTERDSLRALMKTVPVGILIVGAGERVMRINPAAERLLGVTQAEGEGSTCGGLFVCVNRGKRGEACGSGPACKDCGIYGAIREGLDGKATEGVETEVVCERAEQEGSADPITRRLMVSAAPFIHGGVQSVIVAINDITERVKLQAQMAQSDRLASMGMLAAGVAHEINNPLSYVLYNLEQLAEEIPEIISSTQRFLKAEAGARERQREGAERWAPKSAVAQLDDLVTRFRDVLGGTQRIREVTKGLGTFSRVERDELLPVDLNQVLELAVRMARNEIKYRARLTKELQELPKVMANEGRLAQVFLNLLINATHAIEEGAVEANEIRVSTWQRGGEIFAQVKDTGCGIPRAHLDRLFEPFFSTKEVGQGSGLGLSISKTLVESYGGRIQVESEPGVGTHFTVTLPVAREAKEEVPPAETEGEAVPLTGRILVVDDEEPIRVAMERMLSHHETVGASSGAVAKEILEEDAAFDLILCDMMMPEFSGMDLHRWLRTAHPFLAQHLIFITGGAFTPKAREYLGSVENTQIAKPFNMKKLIQTVDERVKRSKEERQKQGRSAEGPGA